MFAPASVAVLCSLLLSSTLAAPAATQFGKCECDISKVKMSVPANQTQLVVPTTPPKFIAVGAGVQNYTCGAAGTFGSVGAVAQLFDASCAAVAGAKALDALPAIAAAAAKKSPLALSFLGKTPLKLGDHFFITNPVTGTGIVPRFTFAASQKAAAAFVDATKAGDIVSPLGASTAVDWLMLKNLDGSLATTVFRVQTSAGVPPTSCTGTQTVSIPYGAEYWFF